MMATTPCSTGGCRWAAARTAAVPPRRWGLPRTLRTRMAGSGSAGGRGPYREQGTQPQPTGVGALLRTLSTTTMIFLVTVGAVHTRPTANTAAALPLPPRTIPSAVAGGGNRITAAAPLAPATAASPSTPTLSTAAPPTLGAVADQLSTPSLALIWKRSSTQIVAPAAPPRRPTPFCAPRRVRCLKGIANTNLRSQPPTKRPSPPTCPYQCTISTIMALRLPLTRQLSAAPQW